MWGHWITRSSGSQTSACIRINLESLLTQTSTLSFQNFWEHRVCTFNTFLGNAHALHSGATLWEPLPHGYGYDWWRFLSPWIPCQFCFLHSHSSPSWFCAPFSYPSAVQSFSFSLTPWHVFPFSFPLEDTRTQSVCGWSVPTTHTRHSLAAESQPPGGKHSMFWIEITSQYRDIKYPKTYIGPLVLVMTVFFPFFPICATACICAFSSKTCVWCHWHQALTIMTSEGWR